MKLNFTNDKMYQMQDAFNALLPDSLTMDHYELANNTHYSSDEWATFLSDGQVIKAIDAEMSVVIRANQNKLISGAADNDRSVGAAQMLNAMTKIDGGEKAEQHFYIYSYIPLTEQETHAPNVRQEDDWVPPVQVVDEVTPADEELKEFCDTDIQTTEVKEEKKEVDDDGWF